MKDLSPDNWKVVQTKTFTKWMNSKLSKAGYPPIRDIFADLTSGIALVNLLRALGKDMAKFNPSPSSRIQKMENLTLILEFIRNQGIALVNIGPSDIVDGDQKLILGLVWTLISRMAISNVLSSEFFSIREEILRWTQRVTESYENVRIENLTTSWQDGMGFNAIIHKFRPHLVQNFYKLDPSEAHKNCEQAFKIAEEGLEIPKLFDAEDIIDAVKPDEKSILTYLSQFYQRFKEEERILALKSHLSDLLKNIDWSILSRKKYEEGATKFLKDKLALIEKSRSAGVLLRALVEEIREIEMINSSLISDSVELSLLLSTIQDTSRLLNLRLYHPPEQLSIDKINISYLKLGSILDLSELRHSIQEFENAEAMEIEKAKTIHRELFSISDKDVQLSVASANEPKFKNIRMSSKPKQSAFVKMRKCFEDKMDRLAKFSETRKMHNSIMDKTKKLFKSKDVKNTGFITASDLRKIIKTLDLDSVMLSDLEMQAGDLISLERMMGIVSTLLSSVVSKRYLRKIFGEISNGGVLALSEVAPGIVLKGLGSFINSENELSLEAIENELSE